MAEGKKSFLAYCDWRDTFDSLPDEKAGQLIKHLFAYVNDEDPQTKDVLINAVFAAIKNTLKRDLTAWEYSKGTKSDNGKLGNLKRWNLELYNQVKSEQITLEEAERIAKDRKESPSDISESQKSQEVANIAVSVSASVTQNNNNNIEARSLAFKKSLFPFIDEYGKEMVKEFYEYWSECGDNDKKMKFEKTKSFSKKARLNRWSKNNFSNTNQNTKPKSTGFLNPGEVPDDVLVMRDHENVDHIKIDCDNFMDSWFRQHLVYTPEECFEKFKKEQPEKFEIYAKNNDKTKPGNIFSAEEIRIGLQHCSKLED